jgi:hypothetical protein
VRERRSAAAAGGARVIGGAEASGFGIAGALLPAASLGFDRLVELVFAEVDIRVVASPLSSFEIRERCPKACGLRPNTVEDADAAGLELRAASAAEDQRVHRPAARFVLGIAQEQLHQPLSAPQRWFRWL